MRQALLSQLRLVPVAVRDDQLAGRGALGARLDRGEQLGHAAYLREIDARTAARVVQVSVHQSRDHRAAAEIDQARRRACAPAQRFAGAHRDEAIAADRHRLRDRERRVDGDDFAVVQHYIRWLRRRTAGARGENAGEQRARPWCHFHQHDSVYHKDAWPPTNNSQCWCSPTACTAPYMRIRRSSSWSSSASSAAPGWCSGMRARCAAPATTSPPEWDASRSSLPGRTTARCARSSTAARPPVQWCAPRVAETPSASSVPITAGATTAAAS